MKFISHGSKYTYETDIKEGSINSENSDSVKEDKDKVIIGKEILFEKHDIIKLNTNHHELTSNEEDYNIMIINVLSKEKDFIRLKIHELNVIMIRITIKLLHELENNDMLFNRKKYYDNLDTLFIFNQYGKFDLIDIVDICYTNLSDDNSSKEGSPTIKSGGGSEGVIDRKDI